MLEPLAEENGHFCILEQALDWRSLFAVLLCGGTVRMTVENYGTLRETLIWQALKHGKREDALPGIRKLQRAIMPLIRSSFYARSEVVALRKRNGGTDNVRVVVRVSGPFWTFALLRSLKFLFSLPSSVSTASGPLFEFDDIYNTPMVRLRKSDAYSSSFILVDANEKEDAAPCNKLPVSARPGRCIEVKFISSVEVDCALGGSGIG
jgi:hypothetical protein